MDSENEIFGKNLQAVRKMRGFSANQLARRLNVTSSSVSLWENGKNLPSTKMLLKICEELDVSPSDLYKEHYIKENLSIDKHSRKIVITKIPVLGNIACGEPIFAENLIEYYVDALDGIKADFAVIAKGDSMINARIYDGDLVFIKKQDMVENGEIAAVLIGDEATLKRVYYDRQNNILTLYPENPKYHAMRFLDDELGDIRILGKAVAFQSLVK